MILVSGVAWVLGQLVGRHVSESEKTFIGRHPPQRIMPDLVMLAFFTPLTINQTMLIFLTPLVFYGDTPTFYGYSLGDGLPNPKKRSSFANPLMGNP